ncbi:MAG: ABC transporter permease [Prevotella sp.]|nr:ABC transporter permease [Prevotella sp.]
MMNISLLHIVLGLLLLAIPAAVLYLFDRKLLYSLGIGFARMVVQVAVLTLIVWACCHWNSVWLNLVWLVAMSVVTGVFVTRKAKLTLSQFLFPVSVGLFAGSLLVGFYLLVAVLPSGWMSRGQCFIPVMALLLGHSAVGCVRGMSTFDQALKTDEQQYEFLRGNGKTHWQAVVPFMRRALQAMLAPTSASLSVMALATMPLLLCGLLLGGIAPLEAAKLLVLLTIGCVAASVVALFTSMWLMKTKRFAWMLLLVVMVAATSCKGKQAEVSQFYEPKTEVAEQKSAPVMYELPAPLTDRPEQILKRRGYTASYNSKTRNPNWVAWHLTKAHTNGSYQRKNEVFSEDTDIKGVRATDNDYYNSRYDRGHMCPAGDNKWDRQAMTESFLFTNVCPQNHGLNKYEWNDLEILCREWAQKYGAIDIVCGPVYTAAGEQKTIGRNKVWVPDAFFKVILCRKGQPKAIGFIYRNEGKKQTQTEALRSVDEIELLTGIDFFPSLDDKTEARVEAEKSLSGW